MSVYLAFPLSVSLPHHCPFPSHTKSSTYTENFHFCKTVEMENSYFIPQINFLGEGENRNSFGINCTCGLLGRDAFSYKPIILYLKRNGLFHKKCFSLTNISRYNTDLTHLHFTFILTDTNVLQSVSNWMLTCLFCRVSSLFMIRKTHRYLFEGLQRNWLDNPLANIFLHVIFMLKSN